MSPATEAFLILSGILTPLVVVTLAIGQWLHDTRLRRLETHKRAYDAVAAEIARMEGENA